MTGGVRILTTAEIVALADLYRLADTALYETRAGGRNQTRCAKPQNILAASHKRGLQVVSAS